MFFIQDLLQAAMANLFTAEAAAFKVSREPSQCHARPPCSLLLNQYTVLPDVMILR